MNAVPLPATRRHRAAGLIVFVLVAVLAGAAIWHSEQAQLQAKRARVAGLAGVQARALQHHLDHALYSTYALAAMVRQG